ncbi:MAG TPA: alpha/beta hydrolase-fold protein [Streptosporangiaceae bacterium]
MNTAGGWRDIRLPGHLLRELHRGYAPLESPAVGYALAAVTLAFGCTWAAFFLWRRRVRPLRRAWPVHLGGSVGSVVLVLATVLAFVNIYAGYAPTLASVPSMLGGTSASAIAARSGGRLRTLVIGAPRLRIAPRTAYVYLPRGYDAPRNRHRRYPVVYLIHGYPGGAYDWLRAGHLATIMDNLTSARLIPPMIAVTPDANGSWFHDSECLNQVHGPQVATYLTHTVVDTVQHRYRALTARRDRLFGGASSGGFCALNIGLRYQAEFGALLAFEPYGTPGAPLQRTLLGGSAALYRANSPSSYIPHLRLRHRVIAYLDAGGAARQDVARVRRLARMLAARADPGRTGRSRRTVVAFRVVPHQTHTWREAANGLPYGLAFVARELHLRTTVPLIEAQRRVRTRP